MLNVAHTTGLRVLHGAGDENRTLTISLGLSAVSTVTSIVAGRRHLPLSVSIRQTPSSSGSRGESCHRDRGIGGNGACCVVSLTIQAR
jgi:hypothetical protein